MTGITGANFVGTNNSKSDDTVGFKAVNPSTSSEIDPIFHSASDTEVEEAVGKAFHAFNTYKYISGNRKALFLESIAEEIMALGDSLVDRAVVETGLPKGRIVGERGRTIGQLKMFADLIREGSWVEASIDTAVPNRQPIPKPDLRKMLIPVGPVVVFGASNFPLAFSTAGGDTVSALAAGNPVIVKAHNSHPGTSELVASAIIRATEKTGMPDGVFSHLQDNGYTVGKALVTHPKVKSVGFTGSFSGGKALIDLASTREEPIPVFAEMSSINPVFLLPGALNERVEEIANMYAGSITLGVGQFCTNPGLLVGLKSEVTKKFSNSLIESISSITNASMLNDGIYKNYNKLKSETIEQNGINVLSTPGDGESAGSNQPQSVVAEVDAIDFIDNPRLHEEVFGPFSLLVNGGNKEELLSIAEKLKGQLTITLMANKEDLIYFRDLIDLLREKAGRLIFNGVPTGVEVCSSMHHGGPFPATTDSRFTSVGTGAIKRFVRPISFQDMADELLPDELKSDNPLGIWRHHNSDWTKEPIR
jgi:NADP-dependent aldehyde dehydrogenase